MQCDATAQFCVTTRPHARARLQCVVYSVEEEDDEKRINARDDRTRTGTSSHLSALTSEPAGSLFLPLLSHSTR